MGLAAPKTKTKLSKDPNNNNWANNVGRFGQKILRSQGWTPGQNLGAGDTKYSDLYHTTASSSHIRVLTKDGNLGIGAKRGRQDDDSFGLDLLSGLLGRLNGKSTEQLDKEEAARRDVKLMRYQSSKKGLVGFHFGGYLVGDDIKPTLVQDDQLKSDLTSKDDKKSKRKRKDDQELVHDSEVPGSRTETKEERRQRKAEKKTKKEARRLRKEQKRLNDSKETSDIDNDSSNVEVKEVIQSTRVIAVAKGRHALRQRYIQQKKLASLDAKAMNEIFMIKTSSV